MIRTQVYLDENIYTQIRLMAKQQGVPAAVLFRKYLSTGLKKNVAKRETASEALLKLAKRAELYKGKKGPRDLSINHDYYLYGGKKRNSNN